MRVCKFCERVHTDLITQKTKPGLCFWKHVLFIRDLSSEIYGRMKAICSLQETLYVFMTMCPFNVRVVIEFEP